jgi:SPX domain protein involved in polyphosphate accumulation
VTSLAEYFFTPVEGAHAGRREFKFLLMQRGGGDAPSRVAASVPALRREYPSRQVTSLYFDSPTLSSYQESTSGMSERVKVRLRWYGALTPETTAVLELKYRANQLGWKSQYALGALPLEDCSLGALARSFGSRVTPAERPLVEVLRVPILVTSYHRHYFCTADGAIRVTVDTGLCVRDQRLRPRLNLTFDGARSGFAVLECKLDPAREHEGMSLLRRLAPRHTRFSKYCHGVERILQR